jgi:hypothetical protein
VSRPSSRPDVSYNSGDERSVGNSQCPHGSRLASPSMAMMHSTDRDGVSRPSSRPDVSYNSGDERSVGNSQRPHGSRLASPSMTMSRSSNYHGSYNEEKIQAPQGEDFSLKSSHSSRHVDVMSYMVTDDPTNFRSIGELDSTNRLGYLSKSGTDDVGEDFFDIPSFKIPADHRPASPLGSGGAVTGLTTQFRDGAFQTKRLPVRQPEVGMESNSTRHVHDNRSDVKAYDYKMFGGNASSSARDGNEEALMHENKSPGKVKADSKNEGSEENKDVARSPHSVGDSPTGSSEDEESSQIGRLIGMFKFNDMMCQQQEEPVITFPTEPEMFHDIIHQGNDKSENEIFEKSMDRQQLSEERDGDTRYYSSPYKARSKSPVYHTRESRPAAASPQPRPETTAFESGCGTPTSSRDLVLRKIRKDVLAVFRQCDVDRDGGLNFLEFSHFLCEVGIFTPHEVPSGHRILKTTSPAKTSPTKSRVSSQTIELLNRAYSIADVLHSPLPLATTSSTRPKV